MAEDRGSDDPVTESFDPFAGITTPSEQIKESQETHVVNLSAEIEGVLHESSHAPETEKSLFEEPGRQPPENSPPNFVSPPLPESTENAVSPPAPDSTSNLAPISFIEQKIENFESPENKLPTIRTPILELSSAPCTPHTAPQQESSSPAPAETLSVPPESEIAALGFGSSTSETDGQQATDIETVIFSEPAEPAESFSEPREVPVIPEDNESQTPKMPSSERISIYTARNVVSPIGSSNELFLSTKGSRETAADSKPDFDSQPASKRASLQILENVMSSNLPEKALATVKMISEELSKNQHETSSEESKPEPLDIDNLQAKSDVTVEKAVTKSALNLEDTAITGESNIEKSSAKDIKETVGKGSCKLEEKSEEPPLNPIVPPIVINSPDESLLINVVDTGPTELQREAEDLKLVALDGIIPMESPGIRTSAPVEVEVAKLAELPTSDVLNKIPELLKNPPTSEDASLTKENLTTEAPIRQRDRSKEPAKRETSKTATKTVKNAVKNVPSPRAPTNPQSVNPGQTIAATSSISATSALSPRSEKGVKLIKSPRPVSARSARLFPTSGDLSSSNSVLGGVTPLLTGPQRVAAARAAAAGAGIKTRKVSSVTTSSAPVDGSRSPRDKPSVTSTTSITPAVASASTTSNISIISSLQKRTSTLSRSSAATAPMHSNASRRVTTGLATTEGYRALGHGGPSHLGIHGPHQKMKASSDMQSLEATYSSVLKSFIDTKREIHQKTKVACDMFTEIERLRHIASTKFGKDLPLHEDLSGLAEAATVPRPAAGAGEDMFSDADSRTIAATEAFLNALTSQKTSLLAETSQHHANLLAWCCEAIGDEGVDASSKLFSEKEFADELGARVREASTVEQTRVSEVLRVLRTSLSDLDETKSSIRELRSQLELLNQENTSLTSSLADCTRELEESRTEFGKIIAKKVAVEKEAKGLRIKLKETEMKAAAEEQKWKELTNQVRSLEDKLRSKDATQDQRIRDTERKVRERFAKDHDELQHRLDEALKEQQLKKSNLEATCQQLHSKLGSVTQLLKVQTEDKEKIEEELKAATEKLSKIAMQRPAETELLRLEREDLIQRLQTMIANENISTGPKLREELQALSDLLSQRERLIEEKDSEIKQLKDSYNEGGDSEISKEAFNELQDTLTKLASHNQMLELELSKMVQSAAKRDRVMGEQEKVLVIREQLIALLQSSNHPAGVNGVQGVNLNDVAIQKKMLDLQTSAERQTVRIKALEAQLDQTEKHQDGLQNLRTRYERRIAQLEHALSDQRVSHRRQYLVVKSTSFQSSSSQWRSFETF